MSPVEDAETVERTFWNQMAPAAFTAAVLLAVDQVSLLVTSGKSFPATGSEWRFQTAAAVIQKVLPMGAVFALVWWVAARAGRDRARNVLALCLKVLVGLLVLAVVVFLIDGFKVKGTLTAGETTGFMVQWLRLLVIGIAAVVGVFRLRRRA
jgi:hypothetical protein